MKRLAFIPLPKILTQPKDLLDIGAALSGLFTNQEDILLLRPPDADTFRAAQTILAGISSTAAIQPDQLCSTSALLNQTPDDFASIWKVARASKRKLVVVLASPEYIHSFFGWRLSRNLRRNGALLPLPLPITAERVLVFTRSTRRFSFLEKKTR